MLWTVVAIILGGPWRGHAP